MKLSSKFCKFKINITDLYNTISLLNYITDRIKPVLNIKYILKIYTNIHSYYNISLH